jgi:hypothetical protein
VEYNKKMNENHNNKVIEQVAQPVPCSIPHCIFMLPEYVMKLEKKLKALGKTQGTFERPEKHENKKWFCK